jgi:membrane protein DedA with SNARE-associated domain
MHYRYAGIFGLQLVGILGFPIPDDTTLVFFGYLVSRSRLGFLAAWLAACLGCLSGVTVSYVLGRTAGHYLLERYGARLGMTPDRISRVHRWFERVGKWGLTFGFFIPGVRHLNGFVAGLTALEFPSFALFAYPGGAVWTLTFLGLGTVLGEGWTRAPETAKPLLLAAAGAGIAAAASYFLFFRPRRAKPYGRPGEHP